MGACTASQKTSLRLGTPNLVYVVFMRRLIFTFITLLPFSSVAFSAQNDAVAFSRLETFGQALFFDQNLSNHRNQSCSSCHDPAKGFSDPAKNTIEGAASIGSDKMSFGDRNAPSLGYAALSPGFHKDNQGEYRGGQFWDGRAHDLKAQAGGPILNPIEMAMPDKIALLERLNENDVYRATLIEHFGEDSLKDADQAFYAVTTALEYFEKSNIFSPFDSKYDRYLKGEYQPTPEEDLGMTLFFSQQFTNCNQCHQLQARAAMSEETFSDYRYHNIGLPPNPKVRALSKVAEDYVDTGLFQNPEVDDPNQAGKFRTPSLRNVAITGPYMHNGIFNDLRTVILFYNKYNSKSAKRQINPETGTAWRAPEVPENIALKELESGPALDDRKINALIAFLEMLTDARYEPLIENQQ